MSSSERGKLKKLEYIKEGMGDRIEKVLQVI